MKRIIGCIASLSLAFSLFAMPALANTPDDNVAQYDSSESLSMDISGVSGQSATDTVPVFHPVAAKDESSENASETVDNLTENPVKSSSEIRQSEDSQPSFLESLLGMLAGISPFSISPESMTGASVQVSLHSLVPSASAESVSDLKVELLGQNGEGRYSASFSSNGRSVDPVVTDVHNASKEADVTVLSDTAYTALVQGVQPGEYAVNVTGGNFGDYAHGTSLTLRNGDMATISLVDCMYTEPIAEDDPYTGLIPYGDFNRDGQVDSTDADIICEALENASTDAIYDLTSDGAFTLADIQLFASNIGRTHAASDTRIVKDVSQMKVQFSEGTQASIVGNSSASQEDVANSLFFDDGDAVALTRQEGSSVSVSTPVGMNIDALGTDVSAFVIQFPKDENGNAVFMGDAGTLTIVLADPEATDDTGSDYKIYADIQVVDESQSPIASLADDESHPFDPMYDTLKSKLYKSTGQLVVIFDPSVTPVNMRSVVAEFTSTTDPAGKAVRIDHIEFLNSLSDLVIPQNLDSPEPQVISADDGAIEVEWDAEGGAAAYDIELVAENSTDLISTASNSFIFTSHSATGEIKNGTSYMIRARSVGLSGFSAWSDPVFVTPESKMPPISPQNLSVNAGYSQISLSWDVSENADLYTVFYKDAADEGSFSSEVTSDTNIVLSGLKNQTSYLIYVVAENMYGQSEATETLEVQTVSSAAKVPWYNLINRTSQNSDKYPISEEISYISVSGLDSKQSEMVVDGDFDTYVDLGHIDSSEGMPSRSVSVGFVEPQNIRNFAIATYMGEGYVDGVNNIFVRAFAENGTEVYSTRVLNEQNGVTWRNIPVEGGSDAIATNVIYVTLPTELKGVSSLNISFSREAGPSTISELAFYWPDGIADRISDLWTDPAHTALMEHVDTEALDAIESAVKTPDVYSAEGEHAAETHPLQAEFEAQIDAAREVLEASDAVRFSVDNTMSFSSCDIAGANAWQPLGVSARAGEKIKVYVGTPDDITGQPTKLKLIASQYRGGADAQFASVGYLMSGMNEITVPVVGNADQESASERGGSLYVEYTGEAFESNYALTIIGGTPIPVLDLRSINEGDEVSNNASAAEHRLELISEYLKELEEHVNHLAELHRSSNHVGTGFFGWFLSEDCTSNMTEIITDYVTLSVPATQVLTALSNANPEIQAKQIAVTLAKIDAQVACAYQQAGIFDTAVNPQLVSEFGYRNDAGEARVNIRCLTLPDNSLYMPLSNCMGISWEQSRLIWSLSYDSEYTYMDDPQTDALEQLGSLGVEFAHALNHQMAQNSYTDPEAFADYFSMLAAYDNEDVPSIDWDNVFKRVTSGVKGSLDWHNALACYWQLHLAYDSTAQGVCYTNSDEWMYGNIFARMAAYSRNPEYAPYGLSMENTDSENILMRLAVAASGRNNLDFFRAWGLEPDAVTCEYASNFTLELRDIRFITDEVRTAWDAGLSGELALPTDFELYSFAESASVIDGGVPNFSMLTGKDNWSISTNMLVEGQDSPNRMSQTYAKAAIPICAPLNEVNASSAIDDDRGSFFTGNTTSDGDAQQVTISLNCVADVSGIRYCPGFKEKSFNGVIVEVSENGKDWIKAAETALYFPASDNYKGYDAYGKSDDATIIFTSDIISGNPNDKDKLATYKASYIRLTEWCENASAVSIAEIDVICNPQYSADFLDESCHYGIGKLVHELILEADTDYGNNGGKIVIPQGSFVIMGDYCGNPVYNTVVLRDGDGNLMADPADQIIIMQGAAGNDVSIVSDAASVRRGTWLYYFEPGTYEDLLDGWHGVRSELYRVDESATLAGAQLVYSSAPVEIPRQGINKEIDVDLFGVQLDFGAYQIQG